MRSSSPCRVVGMMTMSPAFIGAPFISMSFATRRPWFTTGNRRSNSSTAFGISSGSLDAIAADARAGRQEICRERHRRDYRVHAAEQYQRHHAHDFLMRHRAAVDLRLRQLRDQVLARVGATLADFSDA